MPSPSFPSPPPPRRSQASLRLFAPEDAGADGAGSRLSPAMTLRQFFREFYRPVALEAAGASASTISLALDAIHWWEALTDDPPLYAIDTPCTARFVAALQSATYQRGPLAAPRLLAPYTVQKHVRQLRAILRRVGPTLSPDRPAANLAAAAPGVPRVLRAPAVQRPKCCFAADELRRILDACRELPSWPHKGTRKRVAASLDDVATYRAGQADWWTAFLCTLFYVGVRSKTALELKWDSIVDGASVEGGRAGQSWVEIPGADVHKTGKPVARLLHPRAAAELARLRERSPAATRVFRWPHTYEHLSDLHRRLQQAAGVPPIKGVYRSLQAWRRTHATEICRLGGDVRLRAAQWALDHSDSRTTARHYVDFEGAIKAELILALPDIVGARADALQRRLFD